MDPTAILRQIRRTLDQAPDANALRTIRTTLDEPAFLTELDDYLRGVNDPDTKAAILSDIIAIWRLCGDKSAERSNNLTNVRYGIGGGIALAASSLIALATAGPVALVTVFAGMWIAGMSASKTGMLSEEQQVYQDIAGRAAKIREKFDVT